jgi:hypothetical protein
MRRQWPADPGAACAALQAEYSGWEITYSPGSFGLMGPFRASRPHGTQRRSGVDAHNAQDLATGIEFFQTGGVSW